MITYEIMVTELLNRFPVLAPGYKKLAERHAVIGEIPGPHVVYGDLFCDYVVGIAREVEQNRTELERIARWIEELAGSQDVEVQNVIEISVLERLADERIDAIIPFLGRKSSALVTNIGNRLALDPSTWGRLTTQQRNG